MLIKSADNIDVEVTFCDAGYAPGSTPNPILNKMAVWCRPTGGEWIRSAHRSAIQTASIVRRTDAKDLASKLAIKEISYERTEAGSGRNSSSDVAGISTVQGHSDSEAIQPAAGKPEAPGGSGNS